MRYDGHPAGTRPRYIGAGYEAPRDDWSFARPKVPAIELVVAQDIEVRSDHMPYRDGNAITAGLFPAYVEMFHRDPQIRRNYQFPTPDVQQRIDQPAFCVTHFNMRTYGHFLLEVLPKLLVAKHFMAEGLDAVILFPVETPTGILQAVSCIGEADVLLYASSKMVLELGTGYLVSAVSSDMYDMNAGVVADVQALAERLVETPSLGPVPGPRIFLSRRGLSHSSFRRLENEDALYVVAQRFGFVRVEPEKLPWPDQVRMFRGATHVIGEYTSALHGTLFCRDSAVVVSLGCIKDSDIQSAIASSFGHRLAYLLPRNGVLPSFHHGWREVQDFLIEPEDLRRCLSAVF